LNFTLFYQFLNQIGIFVLPAWFFGFLVWRSPSAYLKMDHKPSSVSLLVVTLAVFTILPFINYLSQINDALHFSGSLAPLETWIRNKEEQARQLTEAFLKTHSTGRLMVNLLVMAVLPALGEEMLFRGALQRIITAIAKNAHAGIWITAFLFSAFHLQFLGFLPRFILGLMLGYAFVMSGSLWTAVWMHFVNNASSVLVYFLHYNGYLKVSMERFGASQNEIIVFGSLLLTLWLFIMLYNKEGAAIRLRYFDRE